MNAEYWRFTTFWNFSVLFERLQRLSILASASRFRINVSEYAPGTKELSRNTNYFVIAPNSRAIYQENHPSDS
jgi:hypothetical protein